MAALRERPSLPEHLAFHWRAFGRLTTERPIGFGVGPIPHSAIAAYGTGFGFRGDALARFLDVIEAMDKTYLDWLAERREGSPT